MGNQVRDKRRPVVRDVSFLSRRDYRTQPGGLTPGTGFPKRSALKGRQIGSVTQPHANENSNKIICQP